MRILPVEFYLPYNGVEFPHGAGPDVTVNKRGVMKSKLAGSARSCRTATAHCFVLFSLQLLVCLWWHDYHRDSFPTLKFGVVIARGPARHLFREEPFALSAALAMQR